MEQPNYILIRQIDTGSFGIVYQVYNSKLKQKTAVKIIRKNVSEAKQLEDNSQTKNNELNFKQSTQKFDSKLDPEITNIKKLTHLQIPNVTHYISDGICKLLNNVQYYEMDCQDGNLFSFLKHKNIISFLDYIFMLVEMLYTLMLFRKYSFKHYDIKLKNILYRIDYKPRTYVIDISENKLDKDNNRNDIFNKNSITVTNIIHPIIADFNDSIFEAYDINNERDYTDISDMQEIFITLLESVPDTLQQTEYIQSIFDNFEDDDLSDIFLGKVILYIINSYHKYL